MNILIITENLLQALAAGILVGSVYGLMCVGLGLIYGVMRVINFAQGDFLMLGMYATLYLFGWLGLGQLRLSRFMVYCVSNTRRHHVWPVYGSPTCRIAP